MIVLFYQFFGKYATVAEEILFPTMEIACRFDGMVAPLFKQIQLLRDKCTLAAEARDRLLPKLMNGEIEV